MSTLRVAALYPELMNIYADRGNIAILRARCEWRGLGFELAAASHRRRARPDAHDFFYIGGGQDRDQVAVSKDMARTKRDALHAAADRGAVVLAVCGGYQLLGHSYQLGEERAAGRRAGRPRDRPRGGPAADRQLRDRVRAGASSPASRTTAGGPTWARTRSRSGKVLSGHGNNGKDGYEGVRRGNVIGTYLHGPLLPKNAWLADRLIELALGIELEPLDDRLEDAAHGSARRAAGV